MNISLTGVSQTLMMPLVGRYVISKQNPKLFYDAKSVALVESLDYNFAPIIMSFNSKFTKYIFCARSLFCEQIIEDQLKRFSKLVVVDLGAGFDTTFYRLNNSNVIWVNLDLEEVMQLREHIFQHEEGVCNISGSIFDDFWHEKIKGLGSNVLFISSGVLSYFPNIKVKEFIQSLAKSFPGAKLLFDYTGTKTNSFVNEKIKKSGIRNAFMQLTIDQEADIVDLLSNNTNFKTYKYYAALNKNEAITIKDALVLKWLDFTFKSGYVLVDF